MISQYLTWIKVAAVVVLMSCASVATWRFTSDHYLAQIEANELKYQAAYTAAVKQQADKLTQALQRNTDAETQHDKDQRTINSLSSQLGRVSIHIPASSCESTGSAEAGKGTDGASGIFSERVDAAFAELQAGVDALVQRCDQINIDAARLNAEIGK